MSMMMKMLVTVAARRHLLLILGTAIYLFAVSCGVAEAYNFHWNAKGAAAEKRKMPLGRLRDVPDFQKNLEVQEAANFAVREYSHQQKLAEDLQLWKILSAKYQVVSGTIYYLKLLAGSEKNKKQYEAQVWVKPWEHNYMYLTDFKPTTSWDPSQA
ncbi:hypothetical protein O6H91_09G116800 [Diphasiastrum complanatum]|uniref:Uncharacterized protein n=1 Tax=Diphasiastrum complanatum TaxID=34168 RepID=A0ACC2CTK7_DIPCM|nr:hypothetical protein O6H91_09G116800 [Diphasiastrum complanatum]